MSFITTYILCKNEGTPKIKALVTMIGQQQLWQEVAKKKNDFAPNYRKLTLLRPEERYRGSPTCAVFTTYHTVDVYRYKTIESIWIYFVTFTHVFSYRFYQYYL
jgi:hypothetical protein